MSLEMSSSPESSSRLQATNLISPCQVKSGSPAVSFFISPPACEGRWETVAGGGHDRFGIDDEGVQRNHIVIEESAVDFQMDGLKRSVFGVLEEAVKLRLVGKSEV